MQHYVKAGQHGEIVGHQGFRMKSSRLPSATCEPWDPEQVPSPGPHSTCKVKKVRPSTLQGQGHISDVGAANSMPSGAKQVGLEGNRRAKAWLKGTAKPSVSRLAM